MNKRTLQIKRNCPFCRSKNTELILHDLKYFKHRYWVACECGACGPMEESKHKAISAWNAAEEEVAI